VRWSNCEVLISQHSAGTSYSCETSPDHQSTTLIINPYFKETPLSGAEYLRNDIK